MSFLLLLGCKASWDFELKIISSTLVVDGSSDRALTPLIMRALQHIAPEGSFADIALINAVGVSLRERVEEAVTEYPCDLLFVHRDAENQASDLRMEEITEATKGIESRVVAVIPIKMTESWLIVDEAAIRRAVGNPNGTNAIDLPSIRRIEQVDAKVVLDKALTDATAVGARRRGKFRPERFRFNVADQLPELTSLRRLSSYASFEVMLNIAIKPLLES